MRCKQQIILAISLLVIIICLNKGFATEQDLSREEMRALLQERDAAIIQIQHTVKDLLKRLEAVERSIDPTLTAQSPAPQLPNEEPTTTEIPQGFAKLEVDEQAAQRALERTLIQEGALLLPSWRMEFGPSFAYTLNQFEFPAVVSDGDGMLLAAHNVERTVSIMNLDVRAGLPFDSQLEVGLPYRWADEESRIRIEGQPFGQSSSRSGSGTGSLEIGLAKTFVRERGWRPDVVGRITWDTGSGDRRDNGVFLGGFESVEGSLIFIKRYDPLVFLGSLNYQTFFKDDDIELGDQFAFSFGTALAVSPGSSLFASISNQFLDETEFGNEPIDGSDITSVVLNLGASTIVSRGFLLNLTTGIGISDDAPDYSIGLSASVQTAALRNLFERR